MRSKRSLTISILALALVSLSIATACSAPLPPTASEIIQKYFQKNTSSEQENAKKSHRLSWVYERLLDDRLRVRLPQGTKRATNKQLQQLHTGTVSSPEIDKMIWAKDEEIFVFSAYELFAQSSGDLLQDSRRYLEYRQAAEEYLLRISDPEHAATVLLEPWDKREHPFYRNYLLFDAITVGADETLIMMTLNVYLLDQSRLAVYQELAEEILTTAIPGERTLKAQGAQAVVGSVALQLPSGYTYYKEGTATTQTSYREWSKHFKKEALTTRTETVERYVVQKISAPGSYPQSFWIDFGKNLKVGVPQDTNIDAAPIAEVLLGQPIQWHRTSYHRLEGVVPLKGRQTMRIKINAADEATLWEMLEIARTLRESE